MFRRFLVKPSATEGLRDAGRRCGTDVRLNQHLFQSVEIVLVQTLFGQYAGDLVGEARRRFSEPLGEPFKPARLLSSKAPWKRLDDQSVVTLFGRCRVAK